MSEPTVMFERLPADGPITGNFGDSYTAGGHRGTDIGVPVGTPVYAPAPGVTVAPTNDGSFGNAVCLAHPDGWFTIYAHLSAVKVPLGALIDTGVVLGLSGNTGLSSGPHVHWQLCDSAAFPTDIAHSRNPLNYLISEADMQRLDTLEAIVAGNGMQLVPWAVDPSEGAEYQVLDLFPAGTAPTPRDHPDPDSTAQLLTGAAALEYCRRRGFSLGMGVGLARKQLARHSRDGHGGTL